MEIAHRHNVLVIDDCAHNPGGEYRDKVIGSVGDISTFSFHQQKNMSTLGEGGMLTTSDKALFDRAMSYRSLCCRQYGKSDKYLTLDESELPMNKRYWWMVFDDIGFNFRMTDVQAAAGLIQLDKLAANNAKRNELSAYLTELLSDCPYLHLPKAPAGTYSTWHLYTILLDDNCPVSKVDFMYELYTKYGIKAWSHYLPIHVQKPYLAQGHTAEECPVAMRVFEHYVTLPMNPSLTEEALRYMANAIKSVLASN